MLQIRFALVAVGFFGLELPTRAEQPFSNLVPVIEGLVQLAQPAFPSVDMKLVVHLKAWDDRMKSISSIVYNAERVMNDNVLKRQESKDSVSLILLKPNYYRVKFSRTPVVTPEDGRFFTTWICDGKSLHEYSGTQKEYREYKLQTSEKRISQGNSFLDFIAMLKEGFSWFDVIFPFPIHEMMSGKMSIREVQERFDIKLLGEDASYVYLNIKPKSAGDREDFEEMTLVLFGPNLPKGFEEIRYLPAMIKMTKNKNKEEEVWTFERPIVNSKQVTPEMF